MAAHRRGNTETIEHVGTQRTITTSLWLAYLAGLAISASWVAKMSNVPAA